MHRRALAAKANHDGVEAIRIGQRLLQRQQVRRRRLATREGVLRPIQRHAQASAADELRNKNRLPVQRARDAHDRPARHPSRALFALMRLPVHVAQQEGRHRADIFQMGHQRRLSGTWH